MGMITPTEFKALFKESAELELVGIKNYTRRATIFEAVKTNNQANMQEGFGEGDLCWGFNKGDTALTDRCNIPVITGEISAAKP